MGNRRPGLGEPQLGTEEQLLGTGETTAWDRGKSSLGLEEQLPGRRKLLHRLEKQKSGRRKLLPGMGTRLGAHRPPADRPPAFFGGAEPGVFGRRDGLFFMVALW